jgi:hypothetical protein
MVAPDEAGLGFHRLQTTLGIYAEAVVIHCSAPDLWLACKTPVESTGEQHSKRGDLQTTSRSIAELKVVNPSFRECGREKCLKGEFR